MIISRARTPALMLAVLLTQPYASTGQPSSVYDAH